MLSFWQGTDDECQAVAGSKANDPFPLTPALSLEERENRPPSSSLSSVWYWRTRARKVHDVPRLFPLHEPGGASVLASPEFCPSGIRARRSLYRLPISK